MGRYWELTDAQIRHPLAQRFNVSPSAIVPMLRLGDDGILEEVAARWGLIPFWWKEDKQPRLTFNARSEEAATKPMWRHPASKARCLVPAIGWYEWEVVGHVNPATGEVTKAKQPYFIRLPNGRPIAFAGLMSRRNIEDDKSEFTCAIMTRDAVGPAAEIHTRMPIALPKDAELIEPFPKSGLAAKPTSPAPCRSARKHHCRRAPFESSRQQDKQGQRHDQQQSVELDFLQPDVQAVVVQEVHAVVLKGTWTSTIITPTPYYLHPGNPCRSAYSVGNNAGQLRLFWRPNAHPATQTHGRRLASSLSDLDLVEMIGVSGTIR